MAGKVDTSAHAAAIARFSEAAKYETELLAHVEEITKAAAFKGSHRSQTFLRHIVDRALHGEPADLRERSIGIALFGRPAAYDTADDAIVRVTASDVRKRLLQHYGTSGSHSKCRISLPAGSYVPEFCFVSAAELNGVDSAVAAPVLETVIAAEPVAAPGIVPGSRLRPRHLVLAAILLLVLGAAAWALVHRLMASSSRESLILAAFQNTPHSAQVIVADDALVLIQVLLDRRFTLDEYENLTYLKVPPLVEKKDLLRFWGSLSTRQITNVGDLQNANRIAEKLQARGWDVTIRQARQMHARSFRSGNFVILGSSLSNPWADLFPVVSSNYPFEELPPPGKPEVILNLHPLNGEPAKFEAHKEPGTGRKITFARVYLLENTAHSGRVILVAGQSMSATEMAAELMLRDDSAAQIRAMMQLPPSGPLPDLEMIVRVSEQNEVGDNVEVVSGRKITPRTE